MRDGRIAGMGSIDSGFIRGLRRSGGGGLSDGNHNNNRNGSNSNRSRRRDRYRAVKGDEDFYATNENNTPYVLSFQDVVFILSPFFWPNNLLSRIRSTSTWLLVILSKASTLMAPLFLSQATDALVHQQYHESCRYVVAFCSCRLIGSLLRELQALIFLKVKQQAFVELAEKAFAHVHALSLHWHVCKKTGNVIRYMDRGTEASTQLVSVIFLYLGPTLIEAMAVVCIFLFHFRVGSLALFAFFAVTIFIVVSIMIATWRRKIREENNTFDNDYHEKATDSLLNFETVKYFTNEPYELERYVQAVTLYQNGVTKMNCGQSTTTISQEMIINGTLCGSLFIAGYEVLHGRMQLGNFVAVITYVTFMFAPLAFIGGLYNSINQGIVDVSGLLSLMAERIEIDDEPGAIDIPITCAPLCGYPTTVASKGVEYHDISHQQSDVQLSGLANNIGTSTNFSHDMGSDEGTIMQHNADNSVANPIQDSHECDCGIIKTTLIDLSWKYCPWCGRNMQSKPALPSRTQTSRVVEQPPNLIPKDSAPASMSSQESASGYIEMSALTPRSSSSRAMLNLPSGVEVKFQDVNFHYPEQPVEKGLRNLSFTIPAGTTLAIVGKTGAGKTSISRLLFRFYDPIQGSISLNGFDIREYKVRSIRRAIGVVPQDTVLFNDSILVNIKYGRLDATMEEVIEATRAAQLLPFVESLPNKWDTKVGERGLKLSGGEKQRVAIARCILKNPPVVILDEATSALDTLTEASVQEALRVLSNQRTMLVIAHRLSTILQADQVLVLDSGQIVEIGSPRELLQNPASTFYRMWTTQNGAAKVDFRP